MAFVLSSCLFNPEFHNKLLSEEYTYLDIPTNTIFYELSKITVNKDNLSGLVNYLTNMLDDQTGKIYKVSLETTERTYHKIFDERLEERLLDSVQKIPSNKIEELIKVIY